jgi:ABC-type sugar transport system permease subunit
MGMFVFTQQPLLFGGTNDQTMTISLYVFNIVNTNSSQSAAITAATVGLMFCVLFTPFIFLVKWLAEKFGREAEF